VFARVSSRYGPGDPTFSGVRTEKMGMEAAEHSQRTHNRPFRADPSVAPLAEALWRLRLAPSAHGLHAVLPAESFVSPVLVDLSTLRDGPELELLDVHALLMLPPGPAEVLGPLTVG